MMRKLLDWGGGSVFRSTTPEPDEGSKAAPALAVLFSLMMIPAWIDALGQVRAARPDLWALSAFVGVSYSIACILAVPLARKVSWTSQVLVCLALLAMGIAFVVLTGLENSWVLICALGIVAALMPPVVTGVVTLVTLVGLSASAIYLEKFAEQLPNFILLFSVTAAAALMVGLANAYVELKHARDQIAMFAVAKERARFARDLHDILGHSLTTITLKAGLARRVLETGDLDRTMTEIRDVERLGRQALADVRATVSEYRVVTLSGELAGANETLRAAGIEADLPRAVDDVAPELQPVFGYVLREAVTNVVRHSGAQKVSVRLGQDWISITDDGVGAPQDAAGNGLRGLRERMAAVGGTLETGTPSRGGGFVVRASAPVPEHPEESPASAEADNAVESTGGQA
ncbi:sensor histidine kinase [Allokutzneria albata]|uniref:Two-component system, NarL family, sensor histidine kinase DesK n=1 Tax=Allokutzneria albata TaxID=211114 RepID=A0A1H0BX92_ALLAB|nr:sensor histidine kinase [Allokutzneria albata]SDN50185.1 two-component system, NarL family, sensor histidine kinase DesK [Allokutzneria albata]